MNECVRERKDLWFGVKTCERKERFMGWGLGSLIGVASYLYQMWRQGLFSERSFLEKGRS